MLRYSIPMKSKVDVSSLFQSVGIDRRVVVDVNEHSYEVDLEDAKNNWLYPAFLGFTELCARLQKEGKRVDTFVTVGTGPGIDAIGAFEILYPRTVIMTDVHPDVLPLAQKNFSQHVPNGQVVSQTLQGSLLEPLQARHLKVDVIYANVPNVPFTQAADALLSEQLTSSFFNPKISAGVPQDIRRYMLSMQYRTVQAAYDCLVPGGSVLINLGGRVPVDLVEHMFQEQGYTCEELVVLLKMQSQPKIMLASYAQAEKDNQVEFDFYRYGEARQILENAHKKLSTRQMKSLLRTCRVSATEAWRLFSQHKERIGHIVQLLRGLKGGPLSQF